MTVILNIPKRKHTFKLDDDPKSPEWTLDLTDSEVSRLMPIFRQERENIKAYCDGKADVKQLAEAYKTVITEALGEDAYSSILDYVTDGTNDADNSTIYLAPVVGQIFRLFADASTMRRSNLAEKYVGLDFAY